MASTRNRKPAKSKNASPATTPAKKKRPVTPSSGVMTPQDTIEEVVMSGETAEDSPSTYTGETADKIPVFKDPNFVHSSKGTAATSKRTRVWKNLKQIVAAEKLLPWKPDDVTYGSIEAPPSFKPAKKYSDISGLPALYRDPETKLRYTTAEEYSRLKLMPNDLVTGCLALRKANAPVP
ncbi:INO80 complex subunit C-like [Ylistrum balloti]|uniref:INO80 complex subunit C-like n=1 Tax=Ylistrum balloti TaxID=509963 RepID=UPI002905BBCE|nr:INO80 complex subunit C-like [Ylistrum balloti]